MEQTEDRLRTGRERERIALEIRRCLQNKIRTAGRRKLLLWMFLVMLALSGCGGGTAQTGSTADTAEEAAAAPRETEEVSEAYRKLERASGTIEGRIYTNPYFRLQIAVPEEFSLYGSNVTEQLQGRSRQEAAEAANSYMDMYGRCERDGSLQSVTVLLGNLDSEISLMHALFYLEDKFRSHGYAGGRRSGGYQSDCRGHRISRQRGQDGGDQLPERRAGPAGTGDFPDQ